MAREIALMIVGGLIGVVGIVAGIVSIWLSIQYMRYNRRTCSSGMTGEETARAVLDANGLHHIRVSVTGSVLFGNSYSHYFKKVRLRRFTKHKQSITAVGMGAQKAALAILAKEDDPDMRRRIRLVPLITFGPFAFVPLILIGFLLDYFVFQSSGYCTLLLAGFSVIFYVYSIILSVSTLKTEKKAQERAYEILAQKHFLNAVEMTDLRGLFRLYKIQYINDIIISSLEMLRFVLQLVIQVKNGELIKK